MRSLLAPVIWVGIIGGVWLYMGGRHAAPALPQATQPAPAGQAAGALSIEVTASFTVEPDPFALDADDATKAPALVVRLGGREILRRTDRLEAGVPIRVDDVSGLAAGANELYVEASPALTEADRANALRVRLLRDEEPVAEQTIWSAPGGKVATTVRLTVPAGDIEEPGYDH